MNRLWPVLVAFCLSILFRQPAAAQITGGAPVFFQGFFNLAEAYPGMAGSYPAGLGISGLQFWAGACPSPGAPPTAFPGVLCLKRSGLALDANCFAVIPPGQAGPCFIQSTQLSVTVPGSQKCPDVYGSFSHTYVQFGSLIRTWWSLNFSPPGTQFLLTVTSVCRLAAASGLGSPALHRDLWSWQVVANIRTMAPLIELMHTGAVSTLEVPCIIGEDLYDALKSARQRLADALSAPAPGSGAARNALFDFEALIVSNCLFVDILNPMALFPGPGQFGAPNIQPPGNPAPVIQVPDAGTAVAGIIDTTEHPCCCKLLVDLEAIANQLR